MTDYVGKSVCDECEWVKRATNLATAGFDMSKHFNETGHTNIRWVRGES